jgi:hypothetical protein
MRTLGRFLVLGALVAVAGGAWWKAERRVAPAPAGAPAASSRRAPPRKARGQLPAAGLVAVRGRVVTSGGAPVREAEVSILRRRHGHETLAEVEADASGAFEAWVPPADLVATARAPGLVEGSIAGRAPGDPITITLARGAALAGRVVRADTGEAVPGATVESGAEQEREITARTDGAGRFRLEGLRPAHFRPAARAEGLFGRAGDLGWLGEGETSEETTIVVRPAAALRGRLELAVTAAPCPGGTVELRSEVLGRASATADAAGDVLFPALLPGRYTPHVTCGDHAVDETAPPVDVGTAALAARFVVHEQSVIRGVVVDEQGTPYPWSASIDARPLDTEPEAMGTSTLTLDGGRFVLRGLPAGAHELSASTGAGPLSVRPVVVRVADGVPTPEVRLVAGARYRLEGRVIDEQGRPLALAGLDARQSAESVWEYQLDEDGRFELDGVRAGKVHLSVASGGASLPLQPEPTAPGDHPLTFVVALPAMRIEGRVLSAGPPLGYLAVILNGRAGERMLLDRLSAGADGRFSARVQPDAEYTVSVTSDRGETALAENVTPGAQLALQLRPAATIRGTVRGAPGAFKVAITRTGREEVFFATGGAFELRDVPAGETAVEVTASGVAGRAELTLAPGETRTLDLDLAPPEKPAGDERGRED